MFAHVRGNESIRSTLYYNDRKVNLGKAEVIHASGFIKDVREMSKKDVLTRFDQRISLNDKVQKRVVHISVAFKYTDKLSDEKMSLLADRYMEGIGFKEQPYLVYRHLDVTQPHMHIVSTTIREDGGRIELRDIIFWKSRQVADALAEEFSLQLYKRTDVSQKSSFQVSEAQAVEYGQSPTQRAISDVLSTVIEHYRYGSIAELNAAFREYNLIAHTGKESSHLHKVGGVLFQALDDKGRRIGCPIKASRFFLKPTLKYLEKKFIENRALKEGKGQRIEAAVDWALAGKPVDWAGLRQSLEREGIAVVLQKAKAGEREEVYFVDHRERIVFSGESLGGQYRLPALQQKVVQQLEQDDAAIQRHHLRLHL